MKWTDEQIDDLYRKRSEDLSFEYKDAYWAEMDSMLSEADAVVSEEVSDAEIDAIYQEEAEGLSFTFKQQYWQEFEALLPRKRRLDFLWFFTSLFFMALIGYTTINNKDLDLEPTERNSIASNIKTTADDTDSESKNALNTASTDSEGDKVNEGAPIVWDPSTLQIDFQNFEPNLDAYNSSYYSTYSYDPATSMLSNPLLGTPGELDGKLDKYEEEGNELASGDVDDLPVRELEEASRNLKPYEGEVSTIKSIYVQGIGGLSQSLITPSEAISYSYGIGAGVTWKHKGLSIGVGVNGLISNHNDLQLNRSAKVYGFGSEIHQYNINYKQLYLLEGNLEVGYALKRHEFKIGARPSFAMSSRVSIRQNEASYEGFDVTEVSEHNNVYGYMDGLKRFGIKPTFGYSYSITPSLELGLNLGMQLMPQVNADYLDGENNKLPIDGQLYLRKSFRFGK